MSEAAADPLIGQTLNGRYRIVAPIGSGGMGRVYKAVQTPLDRVVALKVLSPKYSSDKDPGFERRFFLEAAMTAKLHHPSTITIYDYGRTEADVYFIAMEYVEGETLGQILRRDKCISWQRTFHIASQVCRSLREAHKMGVIHRDLKPANIMVLRDETAAETVKVLDFGLVKSFSADSPVAMQGADLTQAGILLGSPLYMAPEQAKNQADPRTDIYSLGAVMYQAIAGRTPFQGKESVEIIVKHVREKPQPLTAMKPEVPEPVNAVVMRCLEKDPARRYQTMDELLDAMKVCITADQEHAARTFEGYEPTEGGIAPQLTTEYVETKITDAQPHHDTRPERLRTAAATTHLANASSGRRLLALAFATAFLAALAGAVAVSAWRTWQRARSGAFSLGGNPFANPTREDRANPPAPEGEVLPLTRGTHVEFRIDSEPSGAQVFREGRLLGRTPLSYRTERATTGETKVLFSLLLDGYSPATVWAASTGDVTEVIQPLVPLGWRNKPGGRQ